MNANRRKWIKDRFALIHVHWQQQADCRG